MKTVMLFFFSVPLSKVPKIFHCDFMMTILILIVNVIVMVVVSVV